MILKRNLHNAIKNFTKHSVVIFLGPKQSGKTEFVRETFKKHVYVELDSPDILAAIREDPARFFRENRNKHGIIFDGFQQAPELMSYIQSEINNKKIPWKFILISCYNIFTNRAITQSIPPEDIGVLHAFPLSINELVANELLPSSVDELILKGGCPSIYAKKCPPHVLFGSYVRTYIERDVRQLVNVENLGTFQKFMKLCAGRIGQQLNITDLATNCGINRLTADRWLSILETSYIIFLLQPHYNTFNKRVTKTPKIYFYDTGLACSLLGIKSLQELSNSLYRGPLFESLILSDFCKQYYSLGMTPSIYFWRDQNGRIDIDCLVGPAEKLLPIIIKPSETIIADFFNTMTAWNSIAKNEYSPGYIVYGGQSTQKRIMGNVINVRLAGGIITDLIAARPTLM